MRKLNKRQILWILRRKREGMSNKDIAAAQKVSPRWVRRLWSQYRRCGKIIVKRPGRPRAQLALGDIKLILIEHPRNSGAVILEKRIYAKHKRHIPKNSIHRVLKMAGYAHDDPKKQKRRKPWIRYEREHSLSLVHTDWYEITDVVPSRWVIAFEDDASRLILAMDEYDAPTTENALKTLAKAMAFAKPYGGIICIISDHGTQFTVNAKGKDGKPCTSLSEFEKFLQANGIGHIMGRIKHPQTNGKIERFYRTFNEKRAKFKTLGEFVEWYNTDRLHMSLKMHYAETPLQAFMRKMEPCVWLHNVKEWF